MNDAPIVMTRADLLVLSVEERIGYMPGEYTAKELATEYQIGTSSTVREALGTLYGEGRIVVAKLREDGEPVWRRATPEERGKL